MTRLTRAMAVVGVGLSVLGVCAGEASAQVAGPGVEGVVQGGTCVAETSSYAPYVSYYAGNGGIAATTSSAWVQCPITDIAGLTELLPNGVFVWIENPSTTYSSSCYLHRVSASTGLIEATTSIVAPTSTTSVSEYWFSLPSMTGGFYSLECYLAPGATLTGYYLNEAN